MNRNEYETGERDGGRVRMRYLNKAMSRASEPIKAPPRGPQELESPFETRATKGELEFEKLECEHEWVTFNNKPTKQKEEQ